MGINLTLLWLFRFQGKIYSDRPARICQSSGKALPRYFAGGYLGFHERIGHHPTGFCGIQDFQPLPPIDGWGQIKHQALGIQRSFRSLLFSMCNQVYPQVT